MTDLVQIQREIASWRERNFPRSGDYHQFLGMVEELGELAHAILKHEQGIREGVAGDCDADARDAIGDLLIYAFNYCTERGWSLEEVLAETWERVRRRNWRDNPLNGEDVKCPKCGGHGWRTLGGMVDPTVGHCPACGGTGRRR